MDTPNSTHLATPLSHWQKIARLLSVGSIALALCGVFIISWSSTMAQSNATVENDIVAAVALNAGAPFPASVRLAATAASHASALVVPQVITTVQLSNGINPHPRAVGVNPKTGYVYVPGEATVTILSGTKIITTVPTGGMVGHAVGVNPTTGYVYVVNYLSNNVTILSDTDVITTVAVGIGPWDIGVNPRTGYVYVSNYFSDNVTVLSGTQVISTVAIGPRAAYVGVNPTTGFAYIDYGFNNVAVLSGTQIIGDIPVASQPQAIGVNPDSGYIYIPLYSWEAGQVAVISGTRVVTTVDVGPAPTAVGVNPLSGYIYVANNTGLTVLSGTQVITTIPAVKSAYKIAVNPVTGSVYVSASGLNVISGTQVITTLATIGADSIGVNPTTGLIYAAFFNRESGADSKVTILSGAQVITTLEGGIAPWAISVNPATGHAYISNAYTKNLTVLSGTQIIANLVLGTAAAVVDPSTGYVYVPTSYYGGGIAVLSGTQIVTTITGLNPYTLQPNPTTGLIYAGEIARRLTILTGTEIITTLNDIGATVIGINPASGYVYVADPDWSPYQLTVLSGANVITTVELGDLRPVGISANPVTGYVYVAALRVNDPAAVVVLSGTQVITTLAVPAERVAGHPSSGYVYAYTTEWNPASYVTVLSGTQAITTVLVGQGGHAIDMDPTTGYVYVSNTGSNDVSVMSGTRVVKTLEVGPTPVSVAVNSTNGLIYVANRNGQSVSIIQELLEPQSMTSSGLLAPDSDLVIDFGEPMITTSIQFAIGPTLLFTVTWSPASDRAIISHDLFEGGRPYTLSILPGGHAISGLTVAERSFNYHYLPIHLFAPTMLRFHQPEVAQRLTFDPADDTEPTLSPDGQTVVFLSDRAGQADVFSASTTGSQATNLTLTPLAQEDTPVYSPDGSQIAFASNRSGDWDIYVMDADGANVRRTIGYTGTDELQPFFTPDGNSLLFSSNLISGNWDIYSATLGSESSSWVRLTTDPTMDRFPSISADGTTIAFRSERDGNSEIYVMDANGSHQRRVTNDPAFDGYPSISPDGSGIVFTSWRSGTPQIYSVNLGGTGLITWTTRLDWEADHPRLSNDGRRLVYAARSVTGTFDIFMRPFATPLYQAAERGALNMSAKCDWEAGTLAYGLAQAWRATENDHYLQWLQNWINACIPVKTTIDHVNDGLLGYAALIAYETQGRPEQLAYAQKVADYFVYTATRTADGTLTHEGDTVWDDTLLGTVTFMVEMSKVSGNAAYLEEAVTQTLKHAQHLQDPVSGLYHHAWDESLNTYWPAYWARGNSWMLLADVELLSSLPITSPQRAAILNLLQKQAAGLKPLQDASGRWHTVVNRPDFYLESSGSALIGYALRRAVQAGWLSAADYDPVARLALWGAWNKVLSDGTLSEVSGPTGPMLTEIEYNAVPANSLQLYGQGMLLLLTSPLTP